MVPIRHVLRSLPLVAAVLGDTYGVSVVIGGSAAQTDGRTITLPNLPAESDASLLPLVRGLIDHEAAHIRETDFAALTAWPSTPFSRHIWNSLEDWRVENRLGDIFPGCRQNFRWLINHYFAGETDRAGDTNPALSILAAILLTVRTWDSPSVQGNRDKAIQEVDTAFPGLWPHIQTILGKARTSCRSTQDAIHFAEEIVAVVQKVKDLPQSEGVTPGQDNGQPASPKDPLTSEGKEEQEGASGKAVKSGGSEQTDTGPCESQGRDDRSSQVQVAAKESLAGVLESAGIADWPLHLGEQLERAITACSTQSLDQGISVARRGDKPGRPLMASDLEECLNASVAMRTRLYRLLQAYQLVRCQNGRRGRLDPKRLHRLLTGDGRVFVALERKEAVHTAVHVLLDSSGSMAGAPLKLAVMACYAVALALERIKGVNVAVSAFPAGSAHDGVTVSPLIAHGQRVHANLGILAEGYTPLAQAVWWVLQQMVLLKEERKVVVIVTDGEPDSVPAVRKVLRTAQATGFEVYGIGIQSAAIQALLPRSSVGVKSLSELPEAMFTLLHRALARGGSGVGQ